MPSWRPGLPSSLLPGLFPSERASTDIYRCTQPAGPLAARWLAGWPLVGAHLCDMGSGYRGSSSQATRYFLHSSIAVLPFLNAAFLFSHLSTSSTTVVGSTAPTSQRAGAPKGQRRAFELLINASVSPPTPTDSAFDLFTAPAVKTKKPDQPYSYYSYRRLDLCPPRYFDTTVSRQVRLSLFVICQLPPRSIGPAFCSRSSDFRSRRVLDR